MKKRGQKGGVVILALVGMSLFMLGTIGLAIDTSYLYSHRQMAQVAADSAAQAAIMSVFDHTKNGRTLSEVSRRRKLGV